MSECVIDAATLDMMRCHAQSLMTERATITRPARTTTELGGSTVVYATVASDVPARVGPLTWREQQIAQRFSATTTVGVTLPANQDVQLRDRIVVGELTLEVQDVSRRLSLEVQRRVMCSEVRALA